MDTYRPRRTFARASARHLLAGALLIALAMFLGAGALAGDLRCDACGRPISGSYRVYQGQNLHESCYFKLYALRCAACGREIVGTYTEYEGKSLHTDCYLKRFARYCGICGRPISGEYTYNSWGDVVCATHIGEYPACEFCGRLKAEKLTGQGTRYPDGREICGKCYASAVAGMDEARALLDSVTAVLARNGIATGLEFGFHLVDQLQMASLTPATGRSSWGYTELRRRAKLLRWLGPDQIDMYVLNGMPRVVFMRVAAHELMHIWLFEHASLQMDHMLVEGSCEYAAYLALSEMDDPLARFDLESQRNNEDLAYGAGFRSVSGYVSQVGVDGWLSFLREHEQPPW